VALPWLDRTADACTDFYQFACGGWRAANPIPADRQRWGQFAVLGEQNEQILRRILESPAPPGDAARRKAADFYAACMDERTIDAKGAAPLAADLARIDAVTRAADLPPLLAHLHSIGVPVFFRFAAQIDRRDATRQIAIADQAGLGMPDRDNYLKADARSAGIRQQYPDPCAEDAGDASGESSRAAADASAVMTIEHALAEAELDRTARRDPAAVTHILPGEGCRRSRRRSSGRRLCRPRALLSSRKSTSPRRNTSAPSTGSWRPRRSTP
jgi:endothelin-converting enzyme/putative endopeptidase